MKREQRQIRCTVRAAGGDNPYIAGFIPYNEPSEDMGFIEYIRPGAFSDSLKNRRIMALWSHDQKKPLANSDSGTLELKDGPNGLSIKINLDPEISWHNDARQSVKRGDVQGFSFGFETIKDEWEGTKTRYLVKCDLFEVSPVVFPAYPTTQANARSKGHQKNRKGTNMNTFKDLQEKYRKIQSEIREIRRIPFDEFTQEDRQAEARLSQELEDVGDRIFEMQGRSSLPSDRTEPRIIKDDDSRENQFRSAGEFFQAVARAGMPNGERHPALRAAAGLSEGIPSDGGFLVSQDISQNVYKLALSTGELAQRCNRVPISSNSNGIKLPTADETSRVNGSRWGGISAYWTGEAVELTASKPKFKLLELSLNKLTGLCYATDELLQDAAALEKVLMQGFAEELNFKLSDAIVRGTGAGMPLGILNSGALVTVGKEVGQTEDTLVYANILKMWERMPARCRKNAVWYINQDIETELFKMSVEVGTGGNAVFLPGGSVAGTPHSSLFGRPIIPIEQCSTAGDVGDIILADLSQYVIIDKGDPNLESSLHVRFVFDESTYRLVYRCDGRPMIDSPVTPFKGSNTLSPFVTLAERAA